MTFVVEPTNQKLYPTPNEHTNFMLNSGILEEYRLAYYINHITRIFGNDQVVRGLDFISYELDNNDLYININSGALIQDNTLIEILYEFDRVLPNLSNNCLTNSDYLVILYTNFKFPLPSIVPTSNPSSFNIHIGILDTSINTVYEGDPTTSQQVIWEIDYNRTIIYAAPITNLDHFIWKNINIGGNIYNLRTQRSFPSEFKFNQFEPFELDGGLLT